MQQRPSDGGAETPFATRLLACVAYGGVSVSITLFNKAVFSVYRFPYPNLVTTLQILVSLLYMAIFSWTRVMHVEAISLQNAKQVFPLAFFWWLYVVSGVTALRYLTVPMYSVLRRATTFLVVGGEWLVFSKTPTPKGLASIGLMILGAILAGATDLSFSLPGYVYVSICAVSTAVYLILIRFIQERTRLNQNSLLFYNNAMALPLMAGYLCLATTELQDAADFPDLGSPPFLGFLLISASQAFLLNLCIFWCTTVNSPLATTVTGQMKDILTTGLGMFMFGDVHLEAKNVVGVVVGLTGGIAYSLVVYLDRQKAKRLPK
ncbi:hypothetical protein WJX73_008278 [Symbiochloris irregularis]|uniref:Sugar phosphate transporter domain-containing protein n=1 Tax=Symbiochloris irregularis TaxID=706552 RepID=A0AAW1P1D9_9CHLO